MTYLGPTNKPKEGVAYFNPDRSGKAHLRHPQYGDVTTACGGSFIHLGSTPWQCDAAEVPPADRCPKCWEAAR